MQSRLRLLDTNYKALIRKNPMWQLDILHAPCHYEFMKIQKNYKSQHSKK